MKPSTVFALLTWFLASSASVCHGSTSSVLLKTGVQKSIQSTASTQVNANVNRMSLRAGRAFTRRVSTSTGFRSFSQRATRLQCELQKSFSLRAIFSDVITNHPGRQTPTSTSTSTSSASEVLSQELLEESLLTPVARRPRVPRLQDLQRIAVGTIQESWGGFVGGYSLALSTGITRKVWGTIFQRTPAAAATTSGHVLPFPGLVRHSQQSLQLHSKSFQFGIEWAQMSAVFGASRLLVQTLRQTEDEWNTVAGSCLAGSIFACTAQPQVRCPPAAMARGALLYGGTMFLLHPNLWNQAMETAMLKPASLTNTAQGPIWDGLQ